MYRDGPVPNIPNNNVSDFNPDDSSFEDCICVEITV